jgi:17beta-estradiol 17-dehydrogenase / very-long-chain 3-oxoacyl-CoA reductase
MFDDVPRLAVGGFAILGVLFVAPLVYRFLSFVWIYFIRPSSVKSYMTGPPPYALITGASDGIGKV